MDAPSSSAPAANSGRARPGRIAVLYDGGCELCRMSAEAVRLFDNSGKIDLLDFNEAGVCAEFPDLAMPALLEELHVVNDSGQVWRGARAINEVLRQQRGIRGVLAYLWYLPGFAWLADRQYKRIAASRGRDGMGESPRPGTACS